MRMKLSSLKILLLVALLALPAATAPTAYTEASTSVQLNASSQAPWRVQSDFGQSPLYFIANQEIGRAHV